MAEDDRQKKKSNRKKRPVRAADRVTVRRVPGRDAFELVHPGCVQERAEDMEEIRGMLEAGEVDVAMDELRWLLGGCNPFIEAHQLLGRIALDDGDLALARAHLGFAFDLGLGALPKRGLSGVLACGRPANRAFFEAGKALAECLKRLGEPKLAAEVVAKLVALDPTMPRDND